MSTSTEGDSQSEKSAMGDYPGADYTMSLYGLKDRNPGEVAGQWKEYIQAEERIRKTHISIRGDSSSECPGEQEGDTEPISYFDNIKKNDNTTSQYDRMFHIQSGFNSRLHRDDRQHTVGLDIQAEERLRNVPIRSSSEYGRRVHAPLEDFTARTHVRIDKVMKGFFRTNGTGIPTPATINDSKITTH